MKAAPVVQASIDAGVRPSLIHTGQHYDRRMSDVFFDQLGLPEPDVNLNVGSGSHAAQTAALMIALEDAFLRDRPSRVVVYGDVNSTLAAALVASKLDIPVAHVEAGLRSYDRTMPEEINRVIADAIAALHFVTSQEAIGNLEKEGADPGSIHFVGNPMIDTLIRFRPKMVEGASKAYGLQGEYGLVTLHRPANVDDESVAIEIISGLRRIADMLPLVIPLHPRGAERLRELGLEASERLLVTEPLGYLDFVSLMAEATVVLTDSGGIQEETTVLGVPCLTLRDNTERPITVTMGTNRLVGRSEDAMVDATRQILSEKPEGKIPPLWDGKAGVRIAQALREIPPS